jgi:hypothetical protein
MDWVSLFPIRFYVFEGRVHEVTSIPSFNNCRILEHPNFVLSNRAGGKSLRYQIVGAATIYV